MVTKPCAFRDVPMSSMMKPPLVGSPLIHDPPCRYTAAGASLPGRSGSVILACSPWQYVTVTDWPGRTWGASPPGGALSPHPASIAPTTAAATSIGPTTRPVRCAAPLTALTLGLHRRPACGQLP